ncbi:hypothetical protein EYR40_002658 [Pleurotus pulmonarius]|nr:hypothetical protein EYR40_002658 [Pleurotus pulmonarius]
MVAPELPIETVTQIIKELGSDEYALAKISRLSRTFRALTLPFLFHHLCISNGDVYRRAYRLLVLESPHIGQYVKQVALDSRGLQTTAYSTDGICWLGADKFLAFLNALPALEALRCDMDFYTGALASVLPNSSITTLHLSDISRESSVDFVNLLMQVLKAGSQTIRSLTLQSIFVDEGIVCDRASRMSLAIPGVLWALEDLTLIQCANLPFFWDNIQMPNVKSLELIDTEWTFRDCMPDSLNTLVIDNFLYVREFQRHRDTAFVAENVILLHSLQASPWLDTDMVGMNMLPRMCIPAGVKSLEIVLLATQGEQLHVDFSKHFERGLQDDIISLHRHGSLEKFLITVESFPGVRKAHLEVFFFKLKSLGVLDVQGGSLPRSCSRPGRYVYPPDSTYYGTGAPNKWTWNPGF